MDRRSVIVSYGLQHFSGGTYVFIVLYHRFTSFEVSIAHANQKRNKLLKQKGKKGEDALLWYLMETPDPLCFIKINII
jgi:hypothetical protein